MKNVVQGHLVDDTQFSYLPISIISFNEQLPVETQYSVSSGRDDQNVQLKASKSMPARVAIVDKRVTFRECMSMFLSAFYGVPVDGYGTLDELLSDPALLHDLILLGATGQTALTVISEINRLCRAHRSSQIMIMLDSCDHGIVCDALRSGARGVLPTTLSIDDTLAAIDLVVGGGTYIPSEGTMQSSHVAASPAKSGIANLTVRETEVLSLLRAGQQNKQIAYTLGLSEGTVKAHLHNMMRKLGTTNRTQTILASSRGEE